MTGLDERPEEDSGQQRSGRTRLIFLGLVVLAALMFAGAVAVRVISSNSDTAVDAKALAVQIQKERIRNIRATCEAQNERHDNTIAQLDELISEAPPERRARARQNRDGTVVLINALVPKRDCRKVVKQASPGG